jgi:hypothetical protein
VKPNHLAVLVAVLSAVLMASILGAWRKSRNDAGLAAAGVGR